MVIQMPKISGAVLSLKSVVFSHQVT